MKILYWLFVLLLFLFASVKDSRQKYQKVTVIIPAFNEEDSVAQVVEVVKKVTYVDEIIVVNDGSTDNTESEALRSGAIVINHEFNKGKGEALFTGYKQSNCDIIAFIDADIQNLTSKKVEAIIKPILCGKTDITKTKFARESGRVTELTAKPLLNFFFPEISFEQPLSGQFAAKKDALRKIKFEKDYGVDVGIVIDADVLGISILEVDIGAIEHDMSPLSDLNMMANEVVRTIMNRANKYGRVTMIDDIGYYIRMSIVGLSLIILGLFTIFFVKFIPLSIGVIISVIGFIMAIYYIIKVIVQSIIMYKKTQKINLFKSFIRIHFPLILSMLILLVMISTFIGAATFDNGTISIEPNSRNLIIYTDESSDNTISVRGPFIVDTAVENESNVIRIPSDAMSTLELKSGDTIRVYNESYLINDSRISESDILRLPYDARNAMGVNEGDVIQNSKLADAFENSIILHRINNSNMSYDETFKIMPAESGGWAYELIVNNVSVSNSSGIFNQSQNYYVRVNGEYVNNIYFNSSIESQNFTYGDYQIEIKFKNTNSSSIKHFDNENFIDLKLE